MTRACWRQRLRLCLRMSFSRVSTFSSCLIFFFNDTATTEIYTLSLHDALPIFALALAHHATHLRVARDDRDEPVDLGRSEEHTSELQSLTNLVCRLLLEKKKSNTSPCTQRQSRGMLEDES